MPKRFRYFCTHGCGCALESWWHFCPACGQSFGTSNLGTVAGSRRRRDGRVEARPDVAPPRSPTARETTAFIQGVAAALASLAREHDRPRQAADILHGLGYDLDDLRLAHVDPNDLRPLRKELLAQR